MIKEPPVIAPAWMEKIEMDRYIKLVELPVFDELFVKKGEGFDAGIMSDFQWYYDWISTNPFRAVLISPSNVIEIVKASKHLTLQQKEEALQALRQLDEDGFGIELEMNTHM